MQEQQQLQQQREENINVSKLLDNYLAEVAQDPNLSITKFQVLAELLPENARTCHDGLYRAIDIYLKVTSTFSPHFPISHNFFLFSPREVGENDTCSKQFSKLKKNIIFFPDSSFTT